MWTQERKHQTIQDVNYQKEGVAVLDTNGTICYLNAAWRTLLGSRDAEAFRIGNNYLEVLHAIVTPDNRYHIQRIAHGLNLLLRGESDYIEVEYPHDRSGQWRWFRVQMSLQTTPDTRQVLLQQCDITNGLCMRAVGQE